MFVRSFQVRRNGKSAQKLPFSSGPHTRGWFVRTSTLLGQFVNRAIEFFTFGHTRKLVCHAHKYGWGSQLFSPFYLRTYIVRIWAWLVRNGHGFENYFLLLRLWSGPEFWAYGECFMCDRWGRKKLTPEIAPSVTFLVSYGNDLPRRPFGHFFIPGQQFQFWEVNIFFARISYLSFLNLCSI